MEKKIYEVIILIDECINNALAPFCWADSYEEATKIARPWVERGYSVVLNVREGIGNE